MVCHQRAVHKRKISKMVLNTNTYLILGCSALALITFYAVPSSGKPKCMLFKESLYKESLSFFFGGGGRPMEENYSKRFN